MTSDACFFSFFSSFPWQDMLCSSTAVYIAECNRVNKSTHAHMLTLHYVRVIWFMKVMAVLTELVRGPGHLHPGLGLHFGLGLGS